MQEKYREAIDPASQILAKALMDDIENVVEQGKLLDKHVQVLVRETGRLTVSRMYAAADHYLTETYKAEGWRIEQHPVVEFRTLFGPVERASAYRWKPGEGHGVRPMKEVMGVVGNGYSEAVERALVDLGSERSFARAAKQFQEHYGWEVGGGVILNHTEAVAQHAEHYVEERLSAAGGGYGKTGVGGTFGVELEGCEIRTGEFWTAAEAGWDGAPADKRVRVEQWKDVRTGFVRPLDEVSRTYVCRVDSYPALCEQLFGAACERGLTPSSQVIAPSDGGNGLQEEMAIHFPNFQYILDHRHLESHFFETAEALGIEKGLQKAWVKAHMDKLWDNERETVLGQLKSLYEDTHNDRLRRLINHLTRFSDAVDYGRFKDNGWPVGSGEVESAHRYIPQERLKIPGACWHPDTVNPMLALRVIRANGWWEPFWQWLHTRRQPQKMAA